MVCGTIGRSLLGTVTGKKVQFQWVKDKSHDGAVRILGGRHLRHCQVNSSLTWRDRHELHPASAWENVKPAGLDMQGILTSAHEHAYDPGNARFHLIWHASVAKAPAPCSTQFGAHGFGLGEIGDYQEANFRSRP